MESAALNAALVHEYSRPVSNEKTLNDEELLVLLADLQEQGLADTVGSAVRNQPLSQEQYAVIAFLDKHLLPPIDQTYLPEPICSKLRSLTITAVRMAIAKDLIAMIKSPIVPVIENLIFLCLGWNDLRGRQLAAVTQKLEDSLKSLSVATTATGVIHDKTARDHLLTLISSDLQNHVTNEHERINKLEQRLIDSESGKTTARRSRNCAARLLNRHMEDKILSSSAIEFLQGVWFDSLQLIATKDGQDSDEWTRVAHLTETLITTLQPEVSGENPFDHLLEQASPELEDATPLKIKDNPIAKANQQRYRIIENLPDELRESMVAIAHDEASITEALELIEANIVQVLRGEPVEGCDLTPLPTEAELPDDSARVSISLMQPVHRLRPQDWFVLQRDDGRKSHVRLTLKDEASQHLIFTNRNGTLALDVSFEEFAYLLSSNKATLLPAKGTLQKQLWQKVKSSLQHKARQDKAIAIKRRKIAEATLSKAIKDTQFVLLAVNKSDLLDGQDIIIKKSDVVMHDQQPSLTFINQTDLSLEGLTSKEIMRLVGRSWDTTSSAPIGMSSFKDAVAKVRQFPEHAKGGNP